MTDVRRINLPYLEELVSLYPYFRALPSPILLDSNHPHFPESEYDILVADPIYQVTSQRNVNKNTSQSPDTSTQNAPINEVSIKEIPIKEEKNQPEWQSTWKDEPLYNIDSSLSVFETLQAVMNHACAEEWAQKAKTDLPFTGGLMGFFGYDSGHFLEKLPDTVIHDIPLPQLQVGLYSWAIISLHKSKQTILMFTPWCNAKTTADIHSLCKNAIEDLSRKENTHVSTQTADVQANQTKCQINQAKFQIKDPFSSNMDKTTYTTKFHQVQNYIQAGDCYQVNLAQRFSSRYVGDTFVAYQSLRKNSPTPFSAYIEIDTIDSAIGSGSAIGSVLSHSPERFLQVKRGVVESKPIKGTRARGTTQQEDDRLAAELLHSSKDKAENLMIVDLLRNDLGKTCDTGSIKVPKLFALESYANVHHLVSTVTGTIQEKSKHFEVFRHSFPGGSITGAPKIRAMEIIDELELHERSIYCGSIAYFSVNGEMDASITIRSLVADKDNIHCWAGGGLVADSNSKEEYKETFTKVKNLTHTLETEFLSKELS